MVAKVLLWNTVNIFPDFLEVAITRSASAILTVNFKKTGIYMNGFGKRILMQ
jgi:hypothetical protein